MKRLAGNPRFWAIVAMMLALSLLHYVEWLGLADTAAPSWHFGLTRHSLDRILFLVPIIYAGHSFRLRTGIATAFAAFLIMLPRAVLASPVPLDALLESVGVVFVGISTCVWFEFKWRAREQKEESVRELENVRENLRYYIQAVTRAQEEERKRISRELHDETVQQLVALSHQLEEYREGNPRLSENDLQALTALQQRLKDAMRSIRLFSRDLRPPMIDDLGLVPALEWLAGQLNSENAMNIEMKVEGVEGRLSPDTELSIFRIIQEALNNARRHAQASEVAVNVDFAADSVDIVVKDNGRGFLVPDSMGDLSKTGKLGLAGMAERARLIGAKLNIQSTPGAGTSVRVHVTR
jgi:two-component system, NarL family, sensor histidine kinase DegS